MTNRRITETNPGFIGPKRRWYDKIRNEFASLEKELDPIAEAYSSLEQRIQQEKSSSEFLLNPDYAIPFAYAFAQLEKLPEVLQKYARPLVRHLKDVKKENGEPDKELQQRGGRICEDIQEWSERFSSLYESHWYKKGLHQQVEEVLELTKTEKLTPKKQLKKIQAVWSDGWVYSGVHQNLIQLFELIEDLSVYQLVLHLKIDEKYGQPFAKLSKCWGKEIA